MIPSSDSSEALEEQVRLWEETLEEDSEVVEVPLNQALMHDIQLLVDRLVAKADRLVGNFTTNMAENWMLIRCKFDGGKFVNRSQSGSFEQRCYGVALQKNLGKTWVRASWEEMTGAPANEILVDTANHLAKIQDDNRKRKRTEKAKESRRRSKCSRVDNTVAAQKAYSHHDGQIEPDDYIEDISDEKLAKEKDKYYKKNVRRRLKPLKPKRESKLTLKNRWKRGRKESLRPMLGHLQK